MDQQYCTGPVAVHVGTGGAGDFVGKPELLGTGERAPRIRNEAGFSPVMSDMSGHVWPFDRIYDGKIGIVTVRLTRWDYDVLRRLQDRTRSAGADSAPGTDRIGHMLIMGQMAVPLWLVYPYSTLKGSMGGMPAGYHYHAAILETDEDQPGATAQSIDLTWWCGRKYDRATGDMVLYDHDMSGLQ